MQDLYTQFQYSTFLFILLFAIVLFRSCKHFKELPARVAVYARPLLADMIDVRVIVRECVITVHAVVQYMIFDKVAG